MNISKQNRLISLACIVFTLSLPASSWAKARAWEGTITIPTYGWSEDVNPKFWALEDEIKLSTTVKGAIVYPYTMQDHLSRTKVDRTYKALFLENEYLKVTCLPELGGRLHSVLDKTTGKEMFHVNHVIKPGMIAMRGAWISGGVEWNTGPHGHTVTIVSPVDALIGTEPGRLGLSGDQQPGADLPHPLDGPRDAASGQGVSRRADPHLQPDRRHAPLLLLELHRVPEPPGHAVHLSDDPRHRPQRRQVLPLAGPRGPGPVVAEELRGVVDLLGGLHVRLLRGLRRGRRPGRRPGGQPPRAGRQEGLDLGDWEFGMVCQKNLTDDDGPYIEVQSGPLPTQSDYGMLLPRQQVAWREWWYPVHGLGDGFEFATRDLAVQTIRAGGDLQLRLLATGRFPGAPARWRGHVSRAWGSQTR